MGQAGAGQALEQGQRQVRRRTVAAGAGVELALLRRRGQVLHRPDRRTGRHHHQHRRRGDARHRHQVFLHAERQPGEQRDIGSMRQRDREPGIAVGRCLGNLVGADVRVAAGLVVDHHGPLPLFRELVPDQPRHDVRQATGRERHHVADRLAGIVMGGHRRLRRALCGGRRRGQSGERGYRGHRDKRAGSVPERGANQTSNHGVSPFCGRWPVLCRVRFRGGNRI
ncbi:hypothetical protein D9M68_394160 [compost metagenome]